jgi:hypothetical protein
MLHGQFVGDRKAAGVLPCQRLHRLEETVKLASSNDPF